MESRAKSNGWQTFLEHWWLLGIAVTFALVTAVLNFFTNLSGTPWIWFFAAAFSLMFLGGALIGCAKFPLYRQGRFLTFGTKTIPEPLRRCYRWGWPAFIAGLVLGLCLLLSKQ